MIKHALLLSSLLNHTLFSSTILFLSMLVRLVLVDKYVVNGVETVYYDYSSVVNVLQEFLHGLEDAGFRISTRLPGLVYVSSSQYITNLYVKLCENVPIGNISRRYESAILYDTYVVFSFNTIYLGDSLLAVDYVYRRVLSLPGIGHGSIIDDSTISIVVAREYGLLINLELVRKLRFRLVFKRRLDLSKIARELLARIGSIYPTSSEDIHVKELNVPVDVKYRLCIDKLYENCIDTNREVIDYLANKLGIAPLDKKSKIHLVNGRVEVEHRYVIGIEEIRKILQYLTSHLQTS